MKLSGGWNSVFTRKTRKQMRHFRFRLLASGIRVQMGIFDFFQFKWTKNSARILMFITVCTHHFITIRNDTCKNKNSSCSSGSGNPSEPQSADCPYKQILAWFSQFRRPLQTTGGSFCKWAFTMSTRKLFLRQRQKRSQFTVCWIHINRRACNSVL